MKAPKQATTETKRELQNLLSNSPTILTLSTGRTIKIKSLYADAQDKIDDIIVHHDEIAKKVNEGKMSEQEGNRYTRQYFAKILAVVLLNHPIKLLFWGVKWRVIHKFWHLTGEDYLNIISEVKKKGHQQEYYLAMALAMTMSDTCTMMTKKEAEVFQQELNSAREQRQ